MNTETRPDYAAKLVELGLSVRSEFVPFSQSRNNGKAKGRKEWLSLNWRITLVYKGRDIITTDYSAGEGHCPASKSPVKFPNTEKVDRYVTNQRIRMECESGHNFVTRKAITPNPADVVSSLVMDSGVIDCGGFEDWAANYGYDTDSRQAESTYRDCLEIALKVRAGIGDATLSTLRELFQDY